MTFHVEVETIHRYERGDTDRVIAASVEAHLTGCPQCRDLLSTDAHWVNSSWHQIADRVEPGPQGLLERFLILVRVPGHIARLLAVTPNLRLSFLLAILFSVIFALTADLTDRVGAAHWIFLLGAPILPVVGVALAYGKTVDPVHETTLATPISTLGLLLMRTAVVVTASVGICLLVWPFVPTPATVGVASWLVPSLALTSMTVALSSQLDTVLAASAVSIGWFVMTMLSLGSDAPQSTGVPIVVMVVLLVISVAVVVTRQGAYEREGSRR